jgi:hypothetical protein
MKAVAIALVLVGCVAGCASPPPRHSSSFPGDSPLWYNSKSECERAGHTWSGLAGRCV